MAPLTSYFVLALGALAAAAPIIPAGQFEGVGLGQALERAPQVGGDGARGAGARGAERPEAAGPDAREAERGAADRGRPDNERGAEGRGRGRPEDAPGAAGRGRPEDARGAAGRGRPEQADERGQGRADVCAAALTQIKANLGDIGGRLRDLNAEFAGSNEALIELFGAMQTGLRGTQAATLKIEEVVAQGGAAPDAERQIIIRGLGQARDALNRLDSNDQALRARLREAKSSMRQTIVTGNRILVACGVAQEGGAPSGAVETSTVSVPPAEETGAASPSVTESGVASQTLTDSALVSATERPTASDSAPVVAPTAAPEAPPAVGAPELITSSVAPVAGVDTCPPAATVTVTRDAAGAPPATVTVTVTSAATEAVSAGVVTSSAAVPSSEAITSSAPPAAAPSSEAVSSAPSSEAVLPSASAVVSSEAAPRPTAGVANP